MRSLENLPEAVMFRMATMPAILSPSSPSRECAPVTLQIGEVQVVVAVAEQRLDDWVETPGSGGRIVAGDEVQRGARPGSLS